MKEKENMKEHNPNWPQIPDHPYQISIIRGSRSGKTIFFSLFILKVISQISIKLIYMLKIHTKQNINF